MRSQTCPALLIVQALGCALSQRVAIVDVPAHIYLGMGGQRLDCLVVVEDSGSAQPASPRGLAIELWMSWDHHEEAYIGVRSADITLPFRHKYSISINTHGSLMLRAVLKPAGSREGVDDGGISQAQHRVVISELRAPLFARAPPDANVRLLEEEEAQEIAAAAVRMYYPTARISVLRVVQAFSIDATPVHSGNASVQQVWVTIQCAQDETSCAAGGFFAFGLDRISDSGSQEHLKLHAARGVPTEVWAYAAPKPLSRLIEHGVCSAQEPLVERSLLPWRRFGSRVRERDVIKVLALADKLCTQRVQIVDNELFVSEPHSDSLPARVLAEGQEKERWYTIALVETLLAVLQVRSRGKLSMKDRENAY